MKNKAVYNIKSDYINLMEGKKVVFIENSSDQENDDGVRRHLKVVGDSQYKAGFYEKGIKRALDVILSGLGEITLSSVFLGMVIAIEVDAPGPVLFTQKHVWKNKKYFKLHKFRTMKMSIPHDVPKHIFDIKNFLNTYTYYENEITLQEQTI